MALLTTVQLLQLSPNRDETLQVVDVPHFSPEKYILVSPYPVVDRISV